MPAEMKRKSEGVYIMFWGGIVTPEDLSEAAKERDQLIAEDKVTNYVLVIDSIRVANPLNATRAFQGIADPAATHHIVVNSSPMAAVIAEHLAQILPQTPVEVRPTQPEAVQYALQLRDM